MPSSRIYINGDALRAAMADAKIGPAKLAKTLHVSKFALGAWMNTGAISSSNAGRLIDAVNARWGQLVISEKTAFEIGAERFHPNTKKAMACAEAHGDNFWDLFRELGPFSDINNVRIRGSTPPLKLIRNMAAKYGLSAEDVMDWRTEPPKQEEPQTPQPPDKPIVVNAEGLALINLEELKAEITAMLKKEDHAALIAQVRAETIGMFREQIKACIRVISDLIKQCEKDESAYMEVGDKRKEMIEANRRRELNQQIQTIKRFAAFAKIDLNTGEVTGNE